MNSALETQHAATELYPQSFSPAPSLPSSPILLPFCFSFSLTRLPWYGTHYAAQAGLELSLLM